MHCTVSMLVNGLQSDIRSKAACSALPLTVAVVGFFGQPCVKHTGSVTASTMTAAMPRATTAMLVQLHAACRKSHRIPVKTACQQVAVQARRVCPIPVVLTVAKQLAKLSLPLCGSGSSRSDRGSHCFFVSLEKCINSCAISCYWSHLASCSGRCSRT